jgi:hypothetical protein
MNELIANVRRLFDQVSREFEERVGAELARSDRAKFMLGAIGLILVLSLTIAVASAADRTKREYRTAQIAYERLKSQVETGSWAERRAQSQAVKLTLEERFWFANTPGLAEAGYERWIRDRLTRYKIEPQSISVRRVAISQQTNDKQSRDPLANVERMTAKIMLPFTQESLIGFLDDIAESERVVVVDRLIVRAARNPRTEIDVSTFYRAPDKGR